MITNSVTEGWQLDAQGAQDYERILAAAFGPWAEGLVALADVKEGERVLDLACGTGIVARNAAKRAGAAGKVVGVDINDNMLTVARIASGERPIEWRLANAVELPFADESFDAVCCEQGMQFVSDPAKGVGEMFRVLARGGRAAVSVCRSLEHCPPYAALGDVLDTLSPTAGAIMRSPFCRWNVGAFRRLFSDAGFENIDVRIEVAALRYNSCDDFLAREAACSPLSETIRTLQPERRRQLVEALESRLREYLDNAGLVCPIQSYVALAARPA
jgi:ubiquinone/menaquinone biosynthesis C-methylase UbiE